MGFRSYSRPAVSLVLFAAGLLPALTPRALAAPAAPAPVQVILDGRPVALDPPATIIGERTLVPLRGVVEAMGARTAWLPETRTVEVAKGDRFARLRIDRRLACLDNACVAASVLDVPATLVKDRTYVPVRFVAQAMGARVSWDGSTRSVLIETNKEPVVEPAPVTVPSVLPGMIISGRTSLQAAGPAGEHVQFYLLDPATGAGPMIAAGNDPAAAYDYTPDPLLRGTRLLVAAVREPGGAMKYAKPVPVFLSPDQSVKLSGPERGAAVSGPTPLNAAFGFTAIRVEYNLLDATGALKEKLGSAGPGEAFTWNPDIALNGDWTLQAVALDREGNAYKSDTLPVKVAVPKRVTLSGLATGDTLTSGWAGVKVNANHEVAGIQYLLDDSHLCWGFSCSWSFTAAQNGPHTLRVRVIYPDDSVTELEPVRFTTDFRPFVRPSGIGPNQVVTGAVTLKAASNIRPVSVEYQLLNARGEVAEVLGKTAYGAELAWTPTQAHQGNRTLRVAARDAAGNVLYSSNIAFRVYLGKTYSPVAVAPKAEFKDLAIRLAGPVYRETGLSAALQVAQALLETGWGQSVPVDKYTGQTSYNLFGIKGKGPAGSVISNTWEEYNGIAYRVDDSFRAYHSIEESWRDHADFLFVRPWYAPVRAVLPNPVLGAWALRKSGYATDSQYPVKLINIMKQYDLYKLDNIEL